jgi:hydrogenase-4 component B
MEITSSGFANSLVMIFRGLLKPTLQYETDYDDSASRYMPRSRSVSLSHGDIYRKYIYRPIYAALAKLSQWFRHVQNGNINSYILYIFIALLITLVVGA